MRIAFLLPSLKFGGAERVNLNLANEFKERGIIVDILLMSYEGEFLKESLNNFNTIDLECNRTYKLPFNLLKYCIKNKPQAIISNFWKINLCSSLCRILYPFFKLILWEHSPPSKTPTSPVWLYKPSASLLYLFSTRIVAVSNGVKSDITKNSFGLQNKLITIYNPIKEIDFRKVNKYNINNSFNIISVGRLEKEKNIELLIQSFNKIQKKMNSKLLIVGDGSERKKLEKLANDLKISTKIIFYGYSNNPYPLMSNSDLLVVSSDFEGLPTVIIEALYIGLPIVSTDSPGGSRELLIDGKYGSLVPVGDSESLAKAIEFEYINNRAVEFQRQGAKRFLPNIIANQFLDLLKND